MERIKKYSILVFIILVSYFAVKPFFASGFFPMHDDTQVARVYEMGKALGDGMFPVRWVSDLGYGYGYPIFNFYAPFAYYVGGFFNLLGFDALTSTKIMMVLGIILSGIFMYLLAREFWGEVGGAMSGLFYAYVPYHAVNIYIRGDVAEFWAYAFIPFVFLGLYKVYKEQKWKWVVLGSLGYASLILSHNLTAMMITPFLIIISLLCSLIAYKGKKPYVVRNILCMIFFGILISAFYWLPALSEMQFTNVFSQIGGGADFRNHFVCLSQLWDSSWGFGGSIPGCIDGMSFKIGKLHIILTFITIILSAILVLKNKLSKQSVLIITFSFLGILISVFLMIEASKPLWEAVSLVEFLQYPWRFLILTSFFSSLLAGAVIFILKEFPFIKQFSDIPVYLAALLFIFLLIFINSKIFNPQLILSKDSEKYTNENELRWKTSKISDEYMPSDFIKPKSAKETVNKIFNPDSNQSISTLYISTQKISARFLSAKNQDLQINIAYFPGWKVFIDGVETEINKKNKGMKVILPSGKHKVDILFRETPIEIFSNLLSAGGVLLLVLGIIIRKHQK